MKKMKLEKGQNFRDIDIEFDEKRYSIEYFKAEGKILLKRLSDNKIIKIFDDHLGFIVQVDNDNKTHFLVSSYGKTQLDNIKLEHYVDYEYNDKLELYTKFENDSIALSKIRLLDNVFIVEKDSSGANLYNLKNYSQRFEKIYRDRRIKALFGIDNNTIMVSQIIKANLDAKAYGEITYSLNPICDYITYGINPETYELTTPIWSEDQQRYIPIYNEEQLSKVEKQKIVQFGYNYLNRKNYSVREIMIELEVRRYLNERYACTEQPKSMYTDDNQINEEFVRSFIKK